MKKWNAGFASQFDTNFYSFIQYGIPTSDAGYRTCMDYSYPGAPSANVLTGTAIYAHCIQKVDLTTRVFGASATRIYEMTSMTAWTDRSAGGLAYTTTANWNATQYGDVTIFTSLTNAPQASSAGAFAALAGTPPKARLTAANNLTVLLANYDDGVTAVPDGWWMSDVGSHVTWTPGAANQAANGRLLQTPGKVTAVVPYRNSYIAFKETGVYRFDYVGLPVIWQVTVLDYNAGATSEDCVCVGETEIIFGNATGFSKFDGVSISKISNGVCNKYLKVVNASAPGTLGAYFDAYERVIYFQGVNAQTNANVCYNVATDAFGTWGVLRTSAAETLRTIVRGASAALDRAFTRTRYGMPFVLVVNGSDSTLLMPSGEAGTTISSNILTMQIWTAVHGSYKEDRTWQRLIPVMANANTVRLAGSGLSHIYVYNYPSAGRSAEEQSQGNGGIDIDNSAAFTDDWPIPPRWDFNKTGKFFWAKMGIGGVAGPAPNGTTVYDYIVESIPAGAT